MGGRRPARRAAPFPSTERTSPESGRAARPVRAPGRRAAAVPASARAAREAGALEEAEGKIKSGSADSDFSDFSLLLDLADLFDCQLEARGVALPVFLEVRTVDVAKRSFHLLL